MIDPQHRYAVTAKDMDSNNIIWVYFSELAQACFYADHLKTVPHMIQVMLFEQKEY